MTDPSTSARPGFDWMAAQAAAASGYAGSRAWSSNGGIEPEGTPIRLVLKIRPAKLAFLLIWRRARDRLSVPFVMFFQSVCALYVVKAALALAIGTPEAPMREKPPLSRWLVVVMEELTSAWIPDIVAIVNMTRAMLARVAPVRNFLFIGYAIAVRTTGRHVRRRTSRVASARIESLLKRTMRSPPRTSMRPAAMNSVMSAFAMLKNFQGLNTHPTMNAPAAVKTARAGRTRIVRTAAPNAKPTGPRSWSNRFWRTIATMKPRAPRTAMAAPVATCRLVERCGTGSGMSRIARTMFSFDTRHEAMTIVAIVIRKPIANPLMRSESVQVRMNPVPPNADAPKTCEKPHRMTPATSRPVNVPTTEDSRAYSRPSDTKLWTRFVRRIPSARATPISPFRSSASMTKMLLISRTPALTVKNPTRTNTWLS